MKKTAKELIADLKATAAELAALKDTNTVFIIMVAEGDDCTGFVGGTPRAMCELTAEIMVRDKKLYKVIENATELAPIILLEQTLYAKPCPCPECTAERNANPSVN